VLKLRTLMSSIICARSALTGRSEGWEIIMGSSLKPTPEFLRYRAAAPDFWTAG
jgi:hypothetical protein